MVTAAAGSDAAVVLVDITKIDWKATPVPLLPQTRRHSLLAHLLRVPNIVFAVNKLDAIEQDTEAAFAAVKASLEGFAAQAGIDVKGVIPVSALRGDNVTTPSANWPWYKGPTLLQVLEALPPSDERHDGALLHPVQYVTRDSVGEGEASASGTGHQYRAFWGRIAHGAVKAGDQVQIFPSGETAIVAEVRHAALVVDQCEAGQSAGIVLDRQVDISRGDWIHSPGSIQPTATFTATLAWLDTEPAVVGRKYWVRHGNRWVQARISSIDSRLDIHTLEDSDAQELAVNEIGRVTVQTQQPLPVEAYTANRVGGALIVVDPTTNRTSGALLVK
jgi:sulfate adenylyltransferase subunit 1